jgi:hypothetical protein
MKVAVLVLEELMVNQVLTMVQLVVIMVAVQTQLLDLVGQYASFGLVLFADFHLLLLVTCNG